MTSCAQTTASDPLEHDQLEQGNLAICAETLGALEQIPALAGALSELAPQRRSEIGEQHSTVFAYIDREPGASKPDPEQTLWLLDELCAALDEQAPAGVSFGLGDDGATLGFWPAALAA